MSCGAAQRVRVPMLAFTDYYETDYANYYERPGTEVFHKQRYASIWQWICESTAMGEPKRILDVGCGQGWLMDLIQETFPEAVVEGVDPSNYNVQVARKKGHGIHEGRLEHIAPTLKPFDLVVSTNVLQHLSNPLDFVSTVSNLVSEGGVIVITCPDGSRPNIELLWADQNLSITPANLRTLATSALPSSDKLTILQSEGSSVSLPPALLMTTGGRGCGMSYNCDVSMESLFHNRRQYLESFQSINEFLFNQLKDNLFVTNLGASYWSSVLAAYCPDYWSLVYNCCVDDPKGQTEFVDKPVVKTADIPNNASVVLGIAPNAQQAAANSLTQRMSRVLCWSQLLSSPY